MPAPTPPPPAEALEGLEEALAELAEFTRDRYVSAPYLINPLLAVWDTAHHVSPDVSRPVEELLTASIHRNLIEAGELEACIGQVRELAAHEALLWQLSNA